MEVTMHGYVAGYYQVYVFLNNKKSFRKYFDNEKEAREFGNITWKRKDVKEIWISKTGFYKKRRNTIRIATATR